VRWPKKCRVLLLAEPTRGVDVGAKAEIYALIDWAVFAIVGATAALSGLILSAQVLTGNGRLATGLELSAIAVVVLGGTPLTGGKASIPGTLLGSLLVAVINNGLNLLNVSVFYQNVTLGLLLLGALTLASRWTSNRAAS
jgi:sugar transport system permease protein